MQTDNVTKLTPKTSKNKIILATRQLFYERGYDGFTVEDILGAADVSRATFYNYFNSKDDIMANWVLLYDDHYQKWFNEIDVNLDALEKLKEYNLFILTFHSNIDINHMKKLYSAHALSKENSFFYDNKRAYCRISQQLAKEGQDHGVITKSFSHFEISEMFSVVQRGIIYNWCVASGTFILEDYGSKIINVFLEGLRINAMPTR